MLTRERLILLAILFLMLASVFTSQYWHNFAYKRESISAALYSFDKKANEKACFTLLIGIENSDGKTLELRAYLDSKEVIREELFAEQNTKKKYCLDLSTLSYGKHNLQIFLGNRKLFYSFEKVAQVEEKKPKIEILEIEGRTIRFEVKDFPESKYEPVEIWVNNKFDHAVYPENKEQEFNEKLSLENGKNEIVIKAFGVEQKVETYYNETRGNILGLLAIMLGLIVFFFFVFSEHAFYERFALSLASLLALFAVLGFLLGLFKAFAFNELALLYGASILTIALIFRKRFKLNEKRIELRKAINEVKIEHLLVITFFVAVTVLYGLFIPNHETYFNIFYERGTEQIIANKGIPEKDALSYLGRTFTFVPGYFYIEGALSLLTGLTKMQLFALTCTIATLFFLSASIALAKSLRLKSSTLFFPIFLSMSTFVFSTLTLTPRHCIALAFMLVALMLALSKKRTKATVMLAITYFVQIPTALFFAILFPILYKVRNEKTSASVIVKESLLLLVSSIFLFSFLYLPIFLRAGFPYQILPQRWGYLISFGPGLVFADPGILFFLFLFFAVLEPFFFAKGAAKITPQKTILFYSSIAILILQAFVSSRLSVVSAVLLALFICYALESHKEKGSEQFAVMLAFVLFIGLYLAVILAQGFTVGPELNSALMFLKQYSSSQENVLADPYFAHLIAYDSQRKTLADLMVEYADERKISDAYKFLKEKDYNIIEKYNISLIFNEKFFINEKVAGNKKLAKELEFEKLAKIFSNERIVIHRVLRN
ncbi:MAG: hypothetical protein J7J87_01200 [Candidatus Diapherotrites archaeon]|nr:hypothetical protein [Candidatus Diapherotrites archaeon]